MDKETAVALAKLEAKDEEKEKRIEAIERAHESWNALIRDAIIKVVTWLMGVTIAGVALGSHLPENIRKSIMEWISK